MDLGAKIKAARLEMGLSQRQLCGDTITRNMLSLIENGFARPSMDTLTCLAVRLGKTVSFFLEENPASPNQTVMERAREAFAEKDWQKAEEILKEYRENDPVFDWERFLLQAEIKLQLGKNAAKNGKRPYALRLLHEAKTLGAQSPYFDSSRTDLALAELGETVMLPDVDRVLELKARQALETGDGVKAEAMLDAMESRNVPQWLLLRGHAYLLLAQWQQARDLLLQAETVYPQETAPLLEKCFSALEDYKNAYIYACKQK